MNIDFGKLKESEKEKYSALCEMPEFKKAGPILYKVLERIYNDVIDNDDLAVEDETDMTLFEKFYSRIQGEKCRPDLATAVDSEIAGYLEENGNTVNMDDILEGLSDKNRQALALLDEVANKILRKEIDIDKGFDELDTAIKWEISKSYRVLTEPEYGIINVILGSKLENAKTL